MNIQEKKIDNSHECVCWRPMRKAQSQADQRRRWARKREREKGGPHIQHQMKWEQHSASEVNFECINT